MSAIQKAVIACMDADVRAEKTAKLVAESTHLMEQCKSPRLTLGSLERARESARALLSTIEAAETAVKNAAHELGHNAPDKARP